MRIELGLALLELIFLWGGGGLVASELLQKRLRCIFLLVEDEVIVGEGLGCVWIIEEEDGVGLHLHLFLLLSFSQAVYRFVDTVLVFSLFEGKLDRVSIFCPYIATRHFVDIFLHSCHFAAALLEVDTVFFLILFLGLLYCILEGFQTFEVMPWFYVAWDDFFAVIQELFLELYRFAL